jgi:chromatin remodeling complex protein RSC6
MVRASSKSSSNATASKPSPEPVKAVEAAAAAPTEKKPRKSAAAVKSLGATETQPLEKVPANEIVVVESAAAAAPGEDALAASSIPTPSLLSAKFAEFGAKMQQTLALLTTLKSEYKILSKVLEKNERLAQKKINDKRKKASGNRQPSGFVKPTRITNELATFLGKSHGTLIARTEVSREINKYIRAHSLQDKSNGRKIIPDEKLSALLNISAKDELTYFNLQKFMKHHFIKEVAAASSV